MRMNRGPTRDALSQPLLIHTRIVCGEQRAMAAASSMRSRSLTRELVFWLGSVAISLLRLQWHACRAVIQEYTQVLIGSNGCLSIGGAGLSDTPADLIPVTTAKPTTAP